MPNPVTDPEILNQLNAGKNPVNDPALLDQLNNNPSDNSTFLGRLSDVWNNPTPGGLLDMVKSGATLPGDVYSGKTPIRNSEGNINQEVIDRSKDFAAIASPMTPGMRAGEGIMGANVGDARLPPPPPSAPGIGELKSSYNEGIKSAQDLGVEIPQKSLYRAQFDIKRKLLNPEDGSQPTDIQIAPKTLGVLDNLGQYKNEVGNVKPTANLGDVENTRKVLNQLLLDQDPHEKAAAGVAIKHLDDYINNLTPERVKGGDINTAKPLLRDARSDYAAASRSQEVLNAVQKANEDAAISGNLETKTRSGLKNLYQNDKRTLGFNEPESKQLETAFRGTTGGNVARGMASVLAPPARNIVSSGASLGGLATVGGLLGGPVGAVGLPVVGRGIGEIARLLGRQSTMKQVQKLDEMIRLRSPRAEIIKALSEGAR